MFMRGDFFKSEYGPWRGGTNHRAARSEKYSVVANARASIPHTFVKSVAFHLLQDI